MVIFSVLNFSSTFDMVILVQELNWSLDNTTTLEKKRGKCNKNVQEKNKFTVVTETLEGTQP